MSGLTTHATGAPRRLLAVGHQTARSDGSLQILFSALPTLTCEWMDWTSLVPQNVVEFDAALILFVAHPGMWQSNHFFHWIKSNPIPRPTAAIVPEDADAGFIRFVASAVDEMFFMPLRPQDLNYRITRLLGNEDEIVSRPSNNLALEMARAGLVGRDSVFLDTMALIPLAARGEAPVLITGETGTGKELCARTLHALGPRKEMPFIPVDCASVPEHLFENELFGHARGAFTDAHNDQRGLVAMADGGTLFLDEIDALPPVAQSKLLRFLQDRTYRSLGSDKFHRANVKIVTATNKDLEALVRNKQFRADLLFRVNVIRLQLPPLRQRQGDIGMLAQTFVNKVCHENRLPRKTLTLATLRSLAEYEWPGNVRELYNVIQRAILLSDGQQIFPWHLDKVPQASPSVVNLNFRQARARVIESFERRYVAELMRECNGNVSRAALLAKKERRTFGRLVKRYHTREELSENVS